MVTIATAAAEVHWQGVARAAQAMLPEQPEGEKATLDALEKRIREALARLEARVAFHALLGRYPDLRLAVDRDALTWAHGDGLVLRGLTSLPVILGPRQR